MIHEEEQAAKRPGIVRRAMVGTVAMILITLVLIVLIEGASSLALAIYNSAKPAVLLQRNPSIRHDADLGWGSTPNGFFADAYGKGVFIKTNSRGFRNKQEFSESPPPGKLRLVCTGDSFAFGFGVSNDDTWCEQLTRLNARLETVNMGEIGYGVDQAYLRYLRDGPTIRHDIHVFTFIARDLRRMSMDEFQGYRKPVLKLRGERLVVENTPVPKWSWRRRMEPFHDLGSLQLLQKVGGRLGVSDAEQSARAEAEERALAWKMLEELQTLHQRENRLLAIVYLPWIEDYSPDPASDERREFFRRETARRGMFYLDLTDRLRTMKQRDAEDLFIREKATWPNIGTWGHYNVEGNRLVASEIYGRLRENPDFARRVEQAVHPN